MSDTTETKPCSWCGPRFPSCAFPSHHQWLEAALAGDMATLRRLGAEAYQRGVVRRGEHLQLVKGGRE